MAQSFDQTTILEHPRMENTPPMTCGDPYIRDDNKDDNKSESRSNSDPSKVNGYQTGEVEDPYGGKKIGMVRVSLQ